MINFGISVTDSDINICIVQEMELSFKVPEINKFIQYLKKLN